MLVHPYPPSPPVGRETGDWACAGLGRLGGERKSVKGSKLVWWCLGLVEGHFVETIDCSTVQYCIVRPGYSARLIRSLVLARMHAPLPVRMYNDKLNSFQF